jgi:alpha-tubulin suppressor-like RCC1 family protein
MAFLYICTRLNDAGADLGSIYEYQCNYNDYSGNILPQILSSLFQNYPSTYKVGATCSDLNTIFLENRFVSEGGLLLTGANGSGQLGNGSTISYCFFGSHPNTNGVNWKQISAGRLHTAAVKTDGTLWTWGNGTDGRLGNSSTLDRSSPVQTTGTGIWKQVSAGTDHTSGIKGDGTLWSFGRGQFGQIGNNSTLNRSSPVQTISGGTDWRNVATGTSFTSAVKTDGTLWTWGLGSCGRLGDNSTVNKSSPVQTISGGTNWRISFGGGGLSTDGMLAIKTDGTLWGWGQGFFGEIGDNTTADKSSPVQTIIGGTNWIEASVNQSFRAGITNTNILYLWGRNTCGQLGNNSTTNASSPIQTSCAGCDWRFVSLGSQHTIAQKVDGTQWVWGRNVSGELGLNNTTTVLVPTSNGAIPASSIATGENFSALILDDYWQ